MEYISNSEAETSRIGSELASALEPGTVVAMYGDLGAGKTAFVRGMAQGLELDARVSSPTFTIVNEYLGRIPLFHFDMYRLADADELFEIGWEDYIQRGGICAVEWSENVEDAFYKDTIRVYIDKLGDTTRKIRIAFPDEDGEDM
jgi:tRNA threonylcarbamoyladenosine biosynthesis protein TsaE